MSNTIAQPDPTVTQVAPVSRRTAVRLPIRRPHRCNHRTKKSERAWQCALGTIRQRNIAGSKQVKASAYPIA